MRLHLVLAVLLPLTVHAQVPRDTTISINASRTTRLVPDRAFFWVVVEGTAETAADAVARAQAKLSPVLGALNALGTVVTVERPLMFSVGVTPANGYPPPTPGTNTSRSVVRVQVSRPERVADVIAAVLSSGAWMVTPTTYESSVADSVRRARLNDVIEVARADAEVMSRALGGRLGAVIDVSTSSSFGQSNNPSINTDNRFPQQSPSPDVFVTTSVSVRFRLLR